MGIFNYPAKIIKGPEIKQGAEKRTPDKARTYPVKTCLAKA
jgi:hypothetical protein